MRPVNIKINENFKKMKQSYLFSEIGKRVRMFSQQHPDAKIIRLGIGDVTLPLTASVIEAMRKAVEEMGEKSTFRGYAPDFGYDFLRKAISDNYARMSVDIPADEIYVSDGAKSDVGNIVDILGSNEVLIPDPVYPVYLDSNIMSGNHVTFISANAQNGFLPLPDENIPKRGYVIYLCSPNNPTGAVYNRGQLKVWVDFALETGSLIIFDSAYEAYIKGDYPHSIYEIEGARECAVEICSFSKTAGFTGTRCAWSVVPANLEASGVRLKSLWERRQTTKYNGVPYVIQRAAEAALSEKGHAECLELVDYYMANAAVIAELLTRKGIWFTGGVSSPYIWLKCPNGMSSWDFFDYLLNEVQVVGTPGEGFGEEGKSYFRLTSFGSREDTEEAVRRLERIL